MKRFSLSAILFSLISVSVFAFSENDIISPAPGTWCNQQALVLSSGNASEIYYSLSGSDPFVSGFAYDGPILIEKKGDVCVRIGVVESDGSKSEYRIDYTVMNAMLSVLDNDVKEFAEKNLVKSPLITYRSGTELVFPNGIRYSFDRNRIPSLRQNLVLKSGNLLERFVSFFVTDGINNYHSVIRVVSSEKSSLEKNTQLPFVIRDWNYFNFTDKKYIYQIDDEMWNSDYSERIINRRQEHVVRFQSVKFSADSPVYQYLIPPAPSVSSKKCGEGTVVFSLSDNYGYTFENGEKTVYAEAFYGEETSSTCETKIFLNGNLNGIIKVKYELDRLPPNEPVFTASENTTFSRNTFALKINSSDNSSVYYAVSKPVYYDDGDEASVDSKLSMPKDFMKYNGGDIIIKSSKEQPCAYKIFAYAVDKAGNISKTVEKKYVIDELNFYLSSDSDSSKADGSFMNPFTSLDQAVKAINFSKGGIKLHLKGDITVEGGEYEILKDCVIHGNGGKIIFNGAASLVVNGVSVAVDNCTLEKHDEGSSLIARVNSGTISLNDCEVTGLYKLDGKLFEIVDSKALFKDCGFTIQASRVAMGAEVTGGSVEVSGCRFTVLGQSNSALKFKNSNGTFEGNLFTLIGGICKGVDITGGSVSFSGDSFNAQSDGKYKNSGAVFRNGGCKVTGLSSTSSKGF